MICLQFALVISQWPGFHCGDPFSCQNATDGDYYIYCEGYKSCYGTPLIKTLVSSISCHGAWNTASEVLLL